MSNSSGNQTICLNVGGVRYETNFNTLKSKPETLLGRFFVDQKNYKPPNNNGEYFFDRNGRIFESILNWYRSQGKDISEFFSEGQMGDIVVIEELKYFKIPYSDSFVNLANRISNKSSSILMDFSQTILKLCIIATDSCMAEFALYPPKHQGDYHCYGKYEFDSNSIETVGFTPVQSQKSGFGDFLPPPRPGCAFKIPIPCTLYKQLLPARRFDHPSFVEKVVVILRKQLPSIKIVNDEYMWIVCGFSDEGDIAPINSEVKQEKIQTYPFPKNDLGPLSK
ncbi:Potassium voltage-gated channel protein egl-36 [Smittium mucronatum]|uniref:Potassium voltage-gated channel protein egl-36 n=1 Tax=Smittium mucronatum TaxID=133383 RepID=A0A1R0GQ92_9FUNG|nr:Potassium voltage-gated channel protein egl-36 [Smittium mucronatum]